MVKSAMKSLFHSRYTPLIMIIAIQILWVGLVASWIIWFVRNQRRLGQLAQKYGPVVLPSGADWFILVEGLFLLALLLVSVYAIHHLWRRQVALNQAQKDFVAQVTHELKSPLASLRLHLETIRLRRPPAEKLEIFIDTMLSDTERLGGLIDNLLATNRLEQRGTRLQLAPIDLSALVSGYLRPRQYSLPRAGIMALNIEEGLKILGETEALETTLRNLVENAVLYSDDAPNITVILKRDGHFAHLVVADCGRGLDRKEVSKVFDMFYRARRKDENIRGSGLGLFIVQTVVRHHQGKVWMESAGIGQGCAVHILLPLAAAESNV